MKRVLVFSDTHGATDAAKRIIAETEGIDCIIHLGDNCRDAEELRKNTSIRVVSIRGNCDYDPSVAAQQLLTIDGARILLVHGHQYHVDTNLLRLNFAAQEAGACAVCFGHTHRALCTYEDGILFLNPGSISRPRDGARSYALLEIRDGFVDAFIIHPD